MIKVLYDISVLGLGYYHPRARTGVFRVVENVAYGLLNSEECELTFCASHSFQNLNASLDYLQSNSQLRQVHLPHSQLKRLLGTRIDKIIQKISISHINQRFLLKILKKALIYLDKPIELIFNPIDKYSLYESDVFHSSFFPIPLQAKRIKGLKRIITIYDLIPILFPQYFEFKEDHLIKEVLKSLGPEDWAFCISNATKNDLCNYLKLDPSRVFVTHLAASNIFYPCSEFEKITAVKKKYGIPDVPYILSLSTLEPRKNIDHTIRCFAKLVQQENIQDLNLVLVGTKGWDYNKIFNEISNYTDLRKRIIITGYVDDEDLAPLYSGAMMFVYPSFYEGFGLPPLEAMQCGVPVITSDTSSLPEVVGDCGFMVDPKDADSLCQKMLELYSSSSLRALMSLRSIQRAKQFSWEKCVEETISAYKTALNS